MHIGQRKKEAPTPKVSAYGQPSVRRDIVGVLTVSLSVKERISAPDRDAGIVTL